MKGGVNVGYILTSGTLGGGQYLARNGPHDFKCIDYLAPLYREFGGRVVASQALIFDTPAAAQQYQKQNAGLVPDGWCIREYDPCMNCVKGVVPCVAAGAGSVPVVGAG